MNAAGVIFDAIAGFLRAVNAVLSVVPGLIWGLALSAALVHTWWVSGERDDAVKEANEAKGAVTQMTGAINAQKRDAAAKLKTLTAERDALQATLNANRKVQEDRDAKNKATIDRQATRLRAMSRDAGGGGLRDPNATGCGGGSGAAESAVAGGPGAGAPDAGKTGGLLSAPLERLLLKAVGESDAINIAYQSCRADALNIRGLPPEPEPPAD